MPRVKSTQVPERSVSATPPASIPLQVGSRGGGPASWVLGSGLGVPPLRPRPALCRPGNCKLNVNLVYGVKRKLRPRPPGPWPARNVPGTGWRRARSAAWSAASCSSAGLSRHPSLPSPCLPLGPPRPQPLLSHRPTSLSGRPQNRSLLDPTRPQWPRVWEAFPSLPKLLPIPSAK